MKRRLLFLFAVFMVGASVGWGQMIPTYYKVAVGTGGDGSSAGSPIYKANLEAALSDAALSSLDSVIILLPEGESRLMQLLILSPNHHWLSLVKVIPQQLQLSLR